MFKKIILTLAFSVLLFSCLTNKKDKENKTIVTSKPKAVEQQILGPGDSGGGGVINSTEEEVIEAIADTQYHVSAFGIRNMLLYLTDLTSEERKALILISNPSAKNYLESLIDLEQEEKKTDFDRKILEQNLESEWESMSEEERLEKQGIGAFSPESYVGQSILQSHRPSSDPNRYIGEIKPVLNKKEYCYSKNKSKALASVSEHGLNAELCFSVKYLKEIPKNSLAAEVAGLWVHELAHMVGFREKVATSLQDKMSDNYNLYIPSYYSPASSWFRQQFDDLKASIFYNNPKGSIEGFVEHALEYPAQLVSQYDAHIEVLKQFINSDTAIRLCRTGRPLHMMDFYLSRMGGRLNYPLWLTSHEGMSKSEFLEIAKLIEWQLDFIKNGDCPTHNTDEYILGHLDSYIKNIIQSKAKRLSLYVHDLVEVEFAFFQGNNATMSTKQAVSMAIRKSGFFRTNLSLSVLEVVGPAPKGKILHDDIIELKELLKKTDDPKKQMRLKHAVEKLEDLESTLLGFLDSDFSEALAQSDVIAAAYLQGDTSKGEEAHRLFIQLVEDARRIRGELIQIVHDLRAAN